MSEKEIIEVFVRVQEPEYYDGIMLLVRVKFAEIVKIGEINEDDFKTGKIACIAASPGSSGLLKKREKILLMSLMRRRRPQKIIILDLSITPTKLTTGKLVIQTILLHSTKIPSKLSKFTSCLPKSSSALPNSITSLPKYCSQLCQCAVEL